MTKEEIEGMRLRSGACTSDDPLVSFLYTLMRDHLPPGKIEDLLDGLHGTTVFTNGWLADYAKDVAARIRSPLVTDPKELRLTIDPTPEEVQKLLGVKDPP